MSNVVSKPPSYKQVALTLVIVAYGFAMIFFAIVRATGALWFSASYTTVEISKIADIAIRFFCYAIDCFVAIKFLIPMSFGVASGFAFIISFIQGYIPHTHVLFLDVFLYLILPVILNKDKALALGNVILFNAGIIAYQLIMMIGRGYPSPIVGKPSGLWMLLSLVDYKMFLIAIIIAKEVRIMKSWDGVGCIWLWGPFDRAARAIGKFIMKLIPHKHA